MPHGPLVPWNIPLHEQSLARCHSFLPAESFPQVEIVEIHGDDQCCHQQRGCQCHRHAHGLIVEECACGAIQEDQRDKHRTGGQHGTQHRHKHLAGTSHCILTLHDIVNHDDGIVHHHTHSEDQSRQRDDVDGDAEQVETEQRQYQRQGDGNNDEQRCAPTSVEYEEYQTGEQGTQHEVPFQVADGVRQQFRLVAVHLKVYGRIVFLQVFHEFFHMLLQHLHLRIVLLDDSQCHGILSITLHDTVPHGSMFRHLTDVLQLHHAVAVPHIQVLNVLLGQYLGIEMHAVAVYAVDYTQGTQRDIVFADDTFYVFHAHAHGSELLHVGHTLYLGSHRTTEIHHRHLRNLFEAFQDDVSHKFRQLGEFPL